MTEAEEPKPEGKPALLRWVEPEVRMLEVERTVFQPTTGGDGNPYSPGGDFDCTRS